jgi:RimJ/RimL family protein N-acetyltransferase
VTLRVRPAVAADARLLLEWRNDPVTRAQSFSQGEIGWDEHVAWLERTLAEPARTRLYIGEFEGQPVGQARVEVVTPARGEISVALAKAARGRGLGAELIAAASAAGAAELRLHELVALIKPGNEASLRAFARAGYAGEGTCTRGGEPVRELHWQPDAGTRLSSGR